jgi:hypothetical protein
MLKLLLLYIHIGNAMEVGSNPLSANKWLMKQIVSIIINSCTDVIKSILLTLGYNHDNVSAHRESYPLLV